MNIINNDTNNYYCGTKTEKNAVEKQKKKKKV